MPLLKGKSKEAVSQNIKKLVEEGKSLQKAVAIALSINKEAEKKSKK